MEPLYVDDAQPLAGAGGGCRQIEPGGISPPTTMATRSRRRSPPGSRTLPNPSSAIFPAPPRFLAEAPRPSVGFS